MLYFNYFSIPTSFLLHTIVGDSFTYLPVLRPASGFQVLQQNYQIIHFLFDITWKYELQSVS